MKKRSATYVVPRIEVIRVENEGIMAASNVPPAMPHEDWPTAALYGEPASEVNKLPNHPNS